MAPQWDDLRTLLAAFMATMHQARVDLGTTIRCTEVR